ncbi:MAG: hypothetical protein SOZ01_03165 [Selenomonadaceae bacterium]|nr:hypothetical protein [Selenomonadaceae bacterium]MDY3915729.1 hypothetical protein [Selenomonadaceae bacterium]
MQDIKKTAESAKSCMGQQTTVLDLLDALTKHFDTADLPDDVQPEDFDNLKAYCVGMRRAVDTGTRLALAIIKAKEQEEKAQQKEIRRAAEAAKKKATEKAKAEKAKQAEDDSDEDMLAFFDE